MNEVTNFETYLLLSPNKFSINVFDNLSFENLYQNEKFIVNELNEIDYDLINDFLNQNIFKVEKKLNNFIKDINLIIGFDVFFSVRLSVKKNFQGNLIEIKDLNNLLLDTKKQCQTTLEGNKISHMIIENYKIDEKDFSFFPNNMKCNDLVIDVNFISLPMDFLNNLEKILKNYHVSTKHILNAKYVSEFFNGAEKDIFKMAKEITDGCNPNEVLLVQKTSQNKGFFEKFFLFFN